MMIEKKDKTDKIEVCCPTCQQRVCWDETYPYRPFCSKQCQLIDFGEWATEAKIIAGDPAIDIDNNNGDDEGEI